MMADSTPLLLKLVAKTTVVLLTSLLILGGDGAAAQRTTTPYPPAPLPETALDGKIHQADDARTDEQAQLNQLFQQGYQYFSRKKYQESAECMLQFLNALTPDAQDYEWAEFFYGISLQKLGFTHAAVDTLTNLVTRKPNPQIVSYVLGLLERISRSGPFDKEMLIHRALCDQSYDFVDGPVAEFVHYYQGEYDWSHGLYAWGDQHFAKLPEESFYHNKYLFTSALRKIYDNRIDEAVALLKAVLLKLKDGDPLKDDARKTLARLYYEKGNFADADFLYQQIEMNIVEQAQNLLERAWVHYRLGNPERAMGLLYSFEAPSYTNSFTPEFYILKSFIYKDVCHYKTAMAVLEQFNVRYGQSLEDIYRRHPLHGNKAMLLFLLNKPRIKELWQFLTLLEDEHALVQNNPDGNLASFLDQVYTLKRQKIERQFKTTLNEAYEKLANSMLQFEEEAHLMEYEIGIDMYQRVRSYHYTEEKAASEQESGSNGTAVYAFQGEFWNDELDHYEVVLPNKCQNAEEWDIFFK